LKTKKTFRFLACFLAFGCGGDPFSAGGSSDAGVDASASGGLAGATGPGGSTSSDTSGGSAGDQGTGGTGGAVGAGGAQAGGSGSGGGAGAAGAGGGAGTGGSGGQGGSVGPALWSLCSGPGQCVIEHTGCCDPCGTPLLESFAGVNRNSVDAFRLGTCPTPTRCTECATAPNVYFGARCVGGQCQAFDVRQVPEFSACTKESDCTLRKGLDCCECGSEAPWTALSVSDASALKAAVCVPHDACPNCLPAPPSNLAAVCSANHCEVAAIP